MNDEELEKIREEFLANPDLEIIAVVDNEPIIDKGGSAPEETEP